MIIETEQQSIFPPGVPVTPATTHVGSDWETILRDISNGLIPCGTKQPFPVNWVERDDPRELPYVIGSNIFGFH
jgi:hypothetical protein